MNLETFKNLILQPVFATNYEVIIYPPKVLNIDSRTLKFFCKSVTTPNYQLNEMKEDILGFSRKKAGKVDFDTITMTFIYNENNFAYDIFQKWIYKINNVDDGVIEYFENYSTDIEINLLDNKLGTIKTWKIQEAYPTSLSSINLSWDSKDEIITFDVVFNFNKFN